MSTSPTLFSGNSRFAGDLQQQLQHAVDIASLPLNQLNSTVSTLNSQVSALQGLTSKFTDLQSAIQSLSSVAGTSALTPTVDDPSVVQASVSAGAIAGTYHIHVVSTGSPTDLISNDGLPTVTDPSTQSISSASSFTLSVGGQNVTITPTGNSLSALAQAINASGAAVNATVINIGSSSAPDYRLALESTDLGDIAIQLNDGSSNLVNEISAGAPAQYQINGQPSTPISSNSDSVTIAPGLTINLAGEGDATVTVGQSDSSISSALSSLATTYNAAVDALNQNHGSTNGALTGQSIVFSLQQSLRSLTGYNSGSGAVQSLADLGLTFDDQGHLNFNASTFNNLVAANPDTVSNFFGSASSSGFLQSATSILTGIDDPNNGILAKAQSTLQDSITKDNQAINNEQARINALQTAMAAQMAAADSAIATLEQQVTLFTGLFANFTNGTQNG